MENQRRRRAVELPASAPDGEAITSSSMTHSSMVSFRLVRSCFGTVLENKRGPDGALTGRWLESDAGRLAGGARRPCETFRAR